MVWAYAAVVLELVDGLAHLSALVWVLEWVFVLVLALVMGHGLLSDFV
jgi:hypothetical protein